MGVHFPHLDHQIKSFEISHRSRSPPILSGSPDDTQAVDLRTNRLHNGRRETGKCTFPRVAFHRHWIASSISPGGRFWTSIPNLGCRARLARADRRRQVRLARLDRMDPGVPLRRGPPAIRCHPRPAIPHLRPPTHPPATWPGTFRTSRRPRPRLPNISNLHHMAISAACLMREAASPQPA